MLCNFRQRASIAAMLILIFIPTSLQLQYSLAFVALLFVWMVCSFSRSLTGTLQFSAEMKGRRISAEAREHLRLEGI